MVKQLKCVQNTMKYMNLSLNIVEWVNNFTLVALITINGSMSLNETKLKHFVTTYYQNNHYHKYDHEYDMPTMSPVIATALLCVN